MSLWIHNAWIPNQGQVNIIIEENIIKAIGPDLAPLPDSHRLDAEHMVAVPGLINGHTHAAMTLLRGYGDDMPLMEWLETRIWPAEARLSEEDVYWGTKLACLEMMRSGTVMFHDMYWNYHGIARAVEEMGIRAGVGAIMIDVAGPDQANTFKKLTQQLWEETSQYSSRIRYELSPHAIYTVSTDSLRWLADFSEKNDVPVHIHLSETFQEVSDCLKKYSVRPAHYLNDVGLLTPRTFLAHGVHLDDEELDLIAEKGATLVTNPVSNLKLAVGGIFPYSEAAKRNIPIALGTDGTASNNTLDLFQDLKTFALIQKHADQDPTTLPAQDAWDIATGARAPLLGVTSTLAAGEVADLLLLRRDLLEITPEHDLVSNLVYAATGHVVDTMIVDGRVVMQNRHVPGEEEILHEARQRAHKLAGG
ncbi:MAG: amidohydrolase [Magnetococcales bacterium]|nr:amidohydrolase [Magnetococcales bacterium]